MEFTIQYLNRNKIPEKDGGIHQEQSGYKKVIQESEDPKDNFRNDIERTQDVYNGDTG